MTLFVDRFTGTTLGSGWTVASSRPAGVAVSGGTLNFTTTYPDDHQVLRGFSGDLEDGYVKFRHVMPALSGTGWVYLYVRAQSDDPDPHRVATVEIYKGNPSFDPIGDNGYTMLLANRHSPAANATSELAYDADRTYFKMAFNGGTVTFQDSADGVSYATIATLASGTTGWNSTSFDLLFNAYAVSDSTPPDSEARLVQVDDVEVSYSAPSLTRTSTGTWNVARSDIVGEYMDMRIHFGSA